MGRVEDGIANFRDFQTFMRDFVSRNDERAKAEELREKTEQEFHDKRDQEHKEAIVARDRTMNLRIALAGLILTLIMAAMEWRHETKPPVVIYETVPQGQAAPGKKGAAEPLPQPGQPQKPPPQPAEKREEQKGESA